MADLDLAHRIRDAFHDADYTVDAVLERIGEEGQRALGRNSTVAAERHLAVASDPLATLVRLFVLQQEVPRTQVEAALPGLVGPMVAAGLLVGDTRAAVDVRPYASDDGASGWIVSDLTNGLDGPQQPPREDYVLGVSPASTSLAQMTIRRPFGSALDLGSGCGVQSLHLARHCGRVVASDLNPRANRLASWTFALNGLDVDQRLGSLYEPVDDERFDLVVTNPPYVMSPPDEHRLTYREGSFTADGLMEAVVRGIDGRLNPGGTLQVLGNWAILRDGGWEERLRSWIPAGHDALVMERERLDPYEYIEIWLADAGLVGTDAYAARYREWLDYFDQLGIVGVGMGWLSVHRTDSSHPDLRVESWPHAVEQPVGDAFREQQEGVAAARCSDDVLWATPWALADDIVQETIGAPGAEDPSHIVLRSQRGFRRAVEVDTGLGGVLGACDGDLPLGVIVDVVAGLLEVDAASLRTEVLPRVRELVADGMLRTR
ncbi:class I SAM-dependent methyltransferase [Mariniluteicoccus endophyticus]